MNIRHTIIFVAFCAFLILGFDAMAQVQPLFPNATPPITNSAPLTQDDGIFDTILNEFFAITSSYQDTIVALAQRLFFALALIHVVWTGMKMALKGTDFQQFVAEVSKMMLFLGFFLILLTNHDFAVVIVDSFVRAAGEVTTNSAPNANAFGGSGEITPSALMALGFRIVTASVGNVSRFAVGSAVLIGIAAILILIAFTLMALRLIMAYVEAYIAVSAGLILLGFGGLSFTSDLAKKYIFYLISVGMKLFVILIVLGLSQQLLLDLINGWAFNNNNQILLILAVSIVMLGLAMSIPNLIAGLISGQAGSGGGEIIGIAAGAAGVGLALAGGPLKTAAAAAKAGANASGGGQIGQAMSVLNKGSGKSGKK